MSHKPVTSASIETDRCVLRPIASGDTPFLFKHFSDPAVHRWLVDQEPPTSEAEAQAITDFYVPGDGSRNRWIIELKESAQPIGTVGFHLWDKDHHRAEIGYDLAGTFWRKGFGTEAVRAAVEFGFTTMSLHRIEAFVHVDNQASKKLLEGLGFQLEGTARENYFARGEYHDHWCFACLAGDLI